MGVPKVMPPILVRRPKMLEANAGDMTVEVEPSREESVSFVALQQIAAEEHSVRMASDMEVRTKQGCDIEFFH
jgi:hypothetical protein